MRAAMVLATCAVLLVACGEEDEAPSRSSTTAPQRGAIELQIRHEDGAGRVTSGRLICRPSEQRATGDLVGRGSGSQLCRAARSLAGLLTTKPSSRRACTQLYGGPETVVVTGTIDGRAVNRRFTRTNGCAIEEYTRLTPILPV